MFPTFRNIYLLLIQHIQLSLKTTIYLLLANFWSPWVRLLPSQTGQTVLECCWVKTSWFSVLINLENTGGVVKQFLLDSEGLFYFDWWKLILDKSDAKTLKMRWMINHLMSGEGITCFHFHTFLIIKIKID